MSLEQAILESVRRLPPARQEQVLHFAAELQQRSAREVPRALPSRDRSREMEWIKLHRAQYADQWVVVEGDRLIAADLDGHKAFMAAKEAASQYRSLFTFFLRIRSRSFRVGNGLDAPLHAGLRGQLSLFNNRWDQCANRALGGGDHKVELIAKLDTGAAYRIFERRYGEELGLDVESGRLQRFPYDGWLVRGI